MSTMMNWAHFNRSATESSIIRIDVQKAVIVFVTFGHCPKAYGLKRM